jgi:hypothetical protein
MAYIIEDKTGAWQQACRENRKVRLGQSAYKTVFFLLSGLGFASQSPIIGLLIAAWYIDTAITYARDEKGLKDKFHREACDRLREANPGMKYEPRKENLEPIFQKHLIPFMV